MNRDSFIFAVALGLSAGMAPNAFGFQEPSRPQLPNFDKRPRQAAPLPGEKQAATTQLAARVPGLAVHFDEVLGTPALISSPRGFLTGPQGMGKAVSASAAQAFPADDPHGPVKAFLNEHAALFGHGAEALAVARVKREFVGAHNGLRTVVWEQHVDGIAVFEALLIGHITKDGELVNLSSHFLPDAVQAANAGHPNRAALQAAPTISAQQAIANTAENLGEVLSVQEISPANGDNAVGAEKQQRFRSPRLAGETEVKLVWLPLDRSTLRLCWEVILTSQARGEMFRVLIDAQSGAARLRHSLTSYISDASYRVYTSDSPSPFSPGHPTPLTNQPPLVSRVLVVTNAFNTNASPEGWIDDGVNETRGNNVDAHTDHDFNNLPDLPRPQGSPFRVFDFSLDLAQTPIAYSDAAVVQLFYLCNWYHDKLYELGFTEAAGNFQNNNFGRGGLGNDAVQADAQDFSGFNNANFATPPDGSPGRMQMYLFNGSDPDRDGDLDAEIVFHEHTHGLSNRRVGGGVGISALQSQGMGEGWSDFYALGLLSEPGDDPGGNFAAGGYATFQLNGLIENYYYGIRRYPYTTNLAKNPLTFKDIDPTQADPHTGIPRSPIFGGGNPAEVHNQGEVWCATLWEARANLVNKWGFAVGNQLMLQLVTDGMNLSPANPNFLQARDAIIQADQVLTGGANFTNLWQAFAKRGMGFGAMSPSSSTTTGVVESYDLSDDLLITPSIGLTSGGPVGGPFNPGLKNYALTNIGTNTITWTVGASTNWLSLSSAGGSLAPGGAATNVMVSLNAAALGLPMGIFTNVVAFTNVTSGRVQTRAFLLAVAQPDPFTELFDAGENDVDFQTLRFTPDGSVSFYTVCRTIATNFPTDPAGGTAVTLTDDSNIRITLAGGQPVSLYGTNYTSFFIGSNGYLTFGTGDNQYFESLVNHFNRARLSGLFVDLDPGKGGFISWKELDNRVVVTWLDVPEFSFSPPSPYTNSLQIELFYDGTIQMTHLRIGSTHGLIGLSHSGGVPPAFIESDMTAYDICETNVLLHFDFSPISATQYLHMPFALTLTAKDAGNDVRSNFTNNIKLLGVKSLGTNGPVKLHTFDLYTDSYIVYPNAIAAISDHFTNYIATTTTTTNPVELRAELADKNVFLILDEQFAPAGFLEAMGTAWTNVLKEFVSRGGVVVVCSLSQDDHRVLQNSGLMALSKGNPLGGPTLAKAMDHVLTEGVAFPFTAVGAAPYTLTNGTTVVQVQGSGGAVVGFRNYGLGHAVIIGSDYYDRVPALDRILANTVQWAQFSAYAPINITPVFSGAFVNGVWTGTLTVLETVTNMFVVAFDEAGDSGVGGLFSVRFNAPPLASNLTFIVNADAATNLQLYGSDADAAALTFGISGVPTNGLLTSLVSSNGLFTYVPAHAYTGPDHFNYTVRDGITNSPPALVSLTVVGLADADGDGIPDVWKIAHGLIPAFGGAGDDPDNDGLTNLQEYLANTDPQNAASGPLNLTVTKNASGSYVLTWKSTGGTRYRVQYSDGTSQGNFNGAFTDIVQPIANEMDPAAIGSSSTMTFTDDFTHTGGAPPQGKRYYRVRVIH